MRASAASRLSTHATLPSSQANHANKANDASPFSLLLESVAPHNAQKTAQKSKSDDKTSDDGDAQNTKADTKTDIKADAAAQGGASAPADKSAKADKADDKTDAKDVAGDNDAATAVPGAVDTTVVPPQVAALATPAAPQTQIASGNAADSDEIAAAASAAAPKDVAKPAPADAAAAQNQAGDQTAGPDAKGPVQAGAAAKPGAHKASADDKDTKTDDSKIEAAKANAPQVASADASAPKPATPPQPANTNLAVHDITAAQAPQSNAPVVTQHIQVTAQAQTAAPNIPALAIEISAKSQSGAKQFDIRLDPPELGRVEVRLSIDATGKASAHLSADQPQTLDLLQKDSTSLMRALRDAGLDVSQDGLNFSLRQQGNNAFAGDQSGGQGNARGGMSLQASKSIEATGVTATTRAPADGRVDISV